MLERIISRARKGAILYFQVPVYSSSYVFDAESYVSSDQQELEMHSLPQSVVFDVLSKGHCRVVEVMEDLAVGRSDWISMTFLAQKK
jgi:hypothetical protein